MLRVMGVDAKESDPGRFTAERFPLVLSEFVRAVLAAQRFYSLWKGCLVANWLSSKRMDL